MRRDYYPVQIVTEGEMGADVDFDEFDKDTWEAADISDLPPLFQWRVVDKLDRLGLVDFRSPVAEGRLRLWRKGRRTLEELAGNPPKFVTCPRWVNVFMLAGGRGAGALAALTEENVAAGEAVARMVDMSDGGIGYHVAIRAMLTGEPSPDEGGWRRTQ